MRTSFPGIVFFLALFAGALPVAAQDGPLFGIKGGVSVANINGLEDTFDSGNRTGFAAGLYVTLGQGMLAVQPEINYTSKGFDLSGLPGAGEFDAAYVQPAIVAKLGLPLGFARPSAFAGVGYGFRLRCEVDGTSCDDIIAVRIAEEEDFSGIFGIDLELLLGGLVLSGDARYEVGFNAINDADDAIGDLKNRAWILRVGLGFRL